MTSEQKPRHLAISLTEPARDAVRDVWTTLGRKMCRVCGAALQEVRKGASFRGQHEGVGLLFLS